jgi:hypothetical protein
MFGMLAVIWGLAAIGVLLGQAIYRLAVISLVGLSMPLHWYHWTGLAGWALFMAYGEGYHGFQKNFSPRVAARAAYLLRHATVVRALLAPLFCMGYFHIERRRQIVVISITLTVIGLIIGAHHLPQPWRGIVDLGVVIGLAWGLVALGFFTVQAFTGRLSHAPEVPLDGLTATVRPSSHGATRPARDSRRPVDARSSQLRERREPAPEEPDSEKNP